MSIRFTTSLYDGKFFSYEKHISMTCFFVSVVVIYSTTIFKHQLGHPGITLVLPLEFEVWHFNPIPIGLFVFPYVFDYSLFTHLTNLWAYWIVDIDEILLRRLLYHTWWSYSCRYISRILVHFCSPFTLSVYAVFTIYDSSSLWWQFNLPSLF